MTQSMTAIEMTDEQIENAINKLRDVMRKHRFEIPSDVAQRVIGVEDLGMVMFVPFRERAEAVSNLIVRKVKVNRGRSQQQAIDATGRVQHIVRKVVNEMPKCEGDEVEVAFFKLRPEEYTKPGYISDDDLEKAIIARGLINDPIAVVAVNEDDPNFADEKQHVTHWKDARGKWCCAVFGHWCDGRGVIVEHRVEDYFANGRWFAGVRK